jgi:2,3-diaminopropionate biosynthesis protein SbnA
MTSETVHAMEWSPPDVCAAGSGSDAGPRDRQLTPWSAASARIGCTPLVRVRLRIRRRWHGLWLKLEQFNRSGSVKDRTAYGLIEDLEERGLMRYGGTIVESTSGNLGIGLAQACQERGYRFIAVVDSMASEYSISRMRDLGACIEAVPLATDGRSLLASRLDRVQELRRLAPGIEWTNQYENLANPRIHRNHTGPEILRQLGRCPDTVFVAVSTGGTLKGIAQYLRAFAPGCRIVAVDVKGSVALGGVPGKRNIPGIGSSRRSGFLRDRPYDLASYVTEEEAIATCHALRICTNIGVGGSSGAVIAAAARFLYANQPGDPIVCLCPDGSDRYEHNIYNAEWLRRKGLLAEGSVSLPFDDIDCNLYDRRPGNPQAHAISHKGALLMLDDALLYLNSDDVILACEEIDPVAAVREALVLHADGATYLPNEAYLGWQPAGGGEARSINMPGLLEGEFPVAGTKIINASTKNPNRGLPRASGVIILFDAITARILCLMEAGHLSGLRTASVSVLASQQLLAPEASAAALLGAGPLARHHAMLISQRLPQITTCRVFDLVPERAAGLCADLADLIAPQRMKFEAVAGPREAVTDADLLVTCTTTRRGYVERSWLKDGCVAVNVSLDDLCEDVLLTADLLYVDDWNLVITDEHRILGRLAREGRLAGPGPSPRPAGAQMVTGTLGELVLDRCEGRSSAEQLCVVNPFGMAIEDLSLAHRVYQVARMRSLGMRIPR